MANKKTNVFDYLEWRGDLTFEQSPFNEIDALILSILAYLDFSCAEQEKTVSFRDAVQFVNQLPDTRKFDGPNIIMHSVVELANQAVGCARFHDMKVTAFVTQTDEIREIQFAAVTFVLSDRTIFLSFRGTDNTLVGWKEDMNMCFTDGIPSQIAAEEYTEQIARRFPVPMRLGGHSKGGNLAIWASAGLPEEYKKNIAAIYSNDAPGFSEEFFDSERHMSICGKIISFVPESSIVGVLMAHDPYTTIRSSNPSVMQHDPFSWLVRGSHFVCDRARTLSGKQFDRVLNSWLSAMSVKEREELVENVYDIFSSSNAKTIDDLDKSKIRSLFLMQKTFREMGLKKQTQLIKSLAKMVFNSDLLPNSNLLTLLSDGSEKSPR